MKFGFIVLLCFIVYCNTQDFQMMYQPLFPSGSNRMNIDTVDNSAQSYFPYLPLFTAPPPIYDTPLNSYPISNQFNVPITDPIVNNTKNQTTNKTHVLPGLNGTPCIDLYKECPDYKDNGYCEKYRKHMLFQCRKTCNFCDIDPFNETDKNVQKVKNTDNAEDEDDDESGSGSGEEENSGDDEDKIEKNSKRSVIENDVESVDNIEALLHNDEKHFDVLKTRFKMPGFVPSLEDLYAEIGTVHPSLAKKSSQNILNIDKIKRNKINDPFKYLRTKVSGSSIKPIVDRSALSSSRVQRSNPVYVFKTARSIISSKSKRSIEETKNLDKSAVEIKI